MILFLLWSHCEVLRTKTSILLFCGETQHKPQYYPDGKDVHFNMYLPRYKWTPCSHQAYSFMCISLFSPSIFFYVYLSIFTLNNIHFGESINELILRLPSLFRWYWLSSDQFSSVQSLSRVWLFVTPWITARQASLSITSSRSLLKLMPIESVMPSSHLILCRLLLLPPIPPSIRVFSNESVLYIRWPKYLEFQLQHQSFQWTPRTELL